MWGARGKGEGSGERRTAPGAFYLGAGVAVAYGMAWAMAIRGVPCSLPARGGITAHAGMSTVFSADLSTLMLDTQRDGMEDAAAVIVTPAKHYTRGAKKAVQAAEAGRTARNQKVRTSALCRSRMPA